MKKAKLEVLKKRIETERKSIQCVRMCILGMPQNDKPLEKAALLFLTHPSLPILLDAHHESILNRKYEVQYIALTAQKERVNLLQKLAKEELAKPTITITPRDLYFELFDGKELFNIARGKKLQSAYHIQTS